MSHHNRLRTALTVAVLTASCSGGSAGRPAPTPAPATSRAATSAATTTSPAPPARWHPAHVVIVIEENHSYSHIIGSPDAPYLNALAATGASLGRLYAIRHPSEPNYLALFSGSTHGLTDDSCPHRYGGPTLAAQLAAAHRTFVGYSEGLPRAGDPVCSAGNYARKHAPWTNFPALPATTIAQPFTAFPPDYTKLPDVAFVIPDLQHDMHDGTVAQADSWLRTNLSRYAGWARTHDSLLIVTWDEDDHSEGNRIPTVVTGAHVRPGPSSVRTDLYGLLRTVEWLFGLGGIGNAAARTPITGIWTP